MIHLSIWSSHKSSTMWQKSRRSPFPCRIPCGFSSCLGPKATNLTQQYDIQGVTVVSMNLLLQIWQCHTMSEEKNIQGSSSVIWVRKFSNYLGVHPISIRNPNDMLDVLISETEAAILGLVFRGLTNGQPSTTRTNFSTRVNQHGIFPPENQRPK